MSEVDFEVLEMRVTHVRVRHLAQGHEYAFGALSAAAVMPRY